MRRMFVKRQPPPAVIHVRNVPRCVICNTRPKTTGHICDKCLPKVRRVRRRSGVGALIG